MSELRSTSASWITRGVPTDLATPAPRAAAGVVARAPVACSGQTAEADGSRGPDERSSDRDRPDPVPERRSSGWSLRMAFSWKPKHSGSTWSPYATTPPSSQRHVAEKNASAIEESGRSRQSEGDLHDVPPAQLTARSAPAA